MGNELAIARHRVNLPARPKPKGRSKAADNQLFDSLAQGWSLSRSCRYAGYDPRAVHDWRKQDREFDLAIIGAIAEGDDYCEDQAKMQAFDGYLKKRKTTLDKEGSPVVEEEWAYAHGLAPTLLQARKPDRFHAKLQVDAQVNASVDVKVDAMPTPDRVKGVLALLAGADPADLAAVLAGLAKKA